MSIEIKQSNALTEEETKTLFGWGDDIFGDLPHQLTWRPKDLHFVLYQDGKALSHVGLLQHTVTVDGQAINVAGLGGVVTVPEAQKQGLAQRLMDHTAEFLDNEWKASAGLLFCLPKMERYYARLGWKTIPGPVTVEQPKGRIISPLLVMVLPLRDFNWPVGHVDLQSLPW